MLEHANFLEFKTSRYECQNVVGSDDSTSFCRHYVSIINRMNFDCNFERSAGEMQCFASTFLTYTLLLHCRLIMFFFVQHVQSIRYLSVEYLSDLGIKILSFFVFMTTDVLFCSFPRLISTLTQFSPNFGHVLPRSLRS